MGLILAKFVLSVCTRILCVHTLMLRCVPDHGKHVVARGGLGLSFIALHLASPRQNISVPPELTGF